MVANDSTGQRTGALSWRLHQHESPEIFNLAVGDQAISVNCERSPAKSTANEDSTMVLHCGDTLVLAVADGVGGLRGGELASELALVTLEESIRNRRPDQSFRSAIVDGIELANRKILDSQIAGASTIVIALIEGNMFRPFHVGDSLAIQTSNRGRLKFQTVAHSPVGMAVEAGLLEEAAAMHHEHRHLVNNVVGSESMRIEIGVPLEIAARDTLILASDGLFDNLLPEEIISEVCKGNLAKAHHALAEKVRFRMNNPHSVRPSKPDDMSIICFRRFGGRGKSLQEITERPKV